MKLTKKSYLKNLYYLWYDENLYFLLKQMEKKRNFWFSLVLKDWKDFYWKTFKNAKLYESKDGYWLKNHKLAVINYQKFNTFKEYEKAEKYRKFYKDFRALKSL